MAKHFETGDRVVYQKQKRSVHPGPRAHEVYPSEHGDEYAYVVDKYWTVCNVPDREHIEVMTRTGKVHTLRVADPLLRKARLLELLFHRNRFPKLEHAEAAA